MRCAAGSLEREAISLLDRESRLLDEDEMLLEGALPVAEDGMLLEGALPVAQNLLRIHEKWAAFRDAA